MDMKSERFLRFLFRYVELISYFSVEKKSKRVKM